MAERERAIERKRETERERERKREREREEITSSRGKLRQGKVSRFFEILSLFPYEMFS